MKENLNFRSLINLHVQYYAFDISYMYMYLGQISLSILLFNDLTLQNVIIDFLSLFFPFLYPSLPLSSLSLQPLHHRKVLKQIVSIPQQ